MAEGRSNNICGLGRSHPAAVEDQLGVGEPALMTYFVKLLTTKTHVVSSRAGKLTLPVCGRATRLPMSPDSYNHTASTRYEFDILCLFSVHHIIEYDCKRTMLVEGRAGTWCALRTITT
jgi:hypothetical protein